MKLDIVAKDYKVSDRLKEVLSAKINKLDKYFNGIDANAKVVLSDNGKQCKMELSIVAHGVMFRSEVVGKTMYYNIDECMPKIERQIVKHREKLFDKNKQPVDNNYLYISEVDTTPNKITKVKSFVIESMSPVEAGDSLDMVDHDFYLFVNKDTGNVELVYRRDDGTVGHLQPIVE